MTVLGIRRVDFAGSDGRQVTGYSLYLSYPLLSPSGSGVGVDKVFLSDYKLMQSDYVPALGDEVIVSYNRYGKLDSIKILGK